MTTSPVTDDIKPPVIKLSPLEWLHQNLFDSIFSTTLTLVSVAAVAWALGSFATWAIQEANWAVIPANLKIFLTGTYPSDQLWRVWIVFGLVMFVLGVTGGAWQGILLQYVVITGLVVGLLALFPLDRSRLLLAGVAGTTFMGTALGWKRERWRPWAIGVWVVLLPILFEILLGGFGEANPPISTKEISGLMLTLVFAVAALVIAFPIGILLALGRTNQDLPVVRISCTLIVEFFRGIPLTTILFAAWLMVPLLLGGINVNLLIRAEVGFILFTAVYVAEDIRGGLQSVPRGQVEAAKALGLNPFQITSLVVLPQALRVALPAIVNEFLTLFKDTSLVVIIGVVELLQAGRVVFNNPDWLGTQKEVLCFVAFVYFIFCYAMAYAAKRLEAQLGLGQR